MEPHALWAFADGRIAVVDRCNDRVQVFTEAGELLSVWEDFYRPWRSGATRRATPM